MRPPASIRKSTEGIAMSVVKFPGQAKRRPFAVAAFDPKRERMLLRAERIVELLSSRAIRDGWSFDKNRAARFLHCLRTFDGNDATSTEVTEIVNWALDYEQSGASFAGQTSNASARRRLRRLAGHQRPCQLRRPVLARAVSLPPWRRTADVIS